MRRKNLFSPILCFAALFFGFVALSCPAPAQADPPQEVTLSHDAATQTLSVTVTHKTLFSGLHYVKQIEIKKNGKTVGSYDFKSQLDKKTFTQSWPIDAKAGDTLEVTARCNLQGSKTATMVAGPAPE